MPDARVLIVGLGNPGGKYDKTRHNAGFLALDYFARRNGLEIRSEKMQGIHCSWQSAGKRVLLLKPMTYMNRSGDCVHAYVNYFQVPLHQILVVHDDLDLDSGRLKMVRGGGAGGHNGIRSLVSHLGAKNFSRLKIGIGHPRNREEMSSMPVERYVLSRFTGEEWELFQRTLEPVAEGISFFIEQGVDAAMNRVNRQERTA